VISTLSYKLPLVHVGGMPMLTLRSVLPRRGGAPGTIPLPTWCDLCELPRVAAGALLLVATPAVAQTLTQRVENVLAEQGPGTRFGMLVVDEAGRELVAIRADDRFVPASNTKLFSTAAAFELLGDVAQPDAVGGASVRLEGRDVVLAGAGDARLSSRADCTVDCLAMLADAVAARTKRVRDVIGDDTTFPDERWSQGMSWNNMPTTSGTALSALTIDDNELAVTVTPGSAAGAPTTIAGGYYEVENAVVTGAAGATRLSFSRFPNTRRLRVWGTVAAGAPETLRVGIDDPAHYAAWRLSQLLAERRVKVSGTIRVRHRALLPVDDPEVRGTAPVVRQIAPTPLAKLTPPPLIEDLTVTNKVSQNVHSELLLRRVGLANGSGSVADGRAAVRAMMDRAGAPRWTYDLADGSGMSSYNRVSPRATVALLRWSTTRPWGQAFRSTLPIAGVDGTLRRRFVDTPLQGRLLAKTGTLDKTNALGGFMTTASGKTLIFAAYANDMPGGASATRTMDAALNLIAAAN
jgi:serine-type D-Ala-D-Ala carboxypeptidase/endopeptidase (penicillin-binding protein 4)